jgi:glycosyltransferase involved in cell wall biosynthesis
VLRALPSIRRHHPEVCYLIVGKTHPGVQRAQKEGYRESLMSLAAELGMEDAVIFLNSYQTKQEIVRCLAATDAYLTPYLGAHQITSGTLAYAVAAGKAIVSTPYLYAQFLLGEGRGRLVPFRDSEAIAGAVNEILDRPEVQRELEARAGAYGRRMYWPTVGRAFLELCQRVAREQPVAAMVSAEGARERLVSRDLAGEVRRDDERSREAHITGPLTTAN